MATGDKLELYGLERPWKKFFNPPLVRKMLGSTLRPDDSEPAPVVRPRRSSPS